MLSDILVNIGSGIGFEPVLIYCQLDPQEQWTSNHNTNIYVKKMHLKMLSAQYQPFWSALNVIIWLIGEWLSQFLS